MRATHTYKIFRHEHSTASPRTQIRDPHLTPAAIFNRSYLRYSLWTFRLQSSTPVKLRSDFASGGIRVSALGSLYFFAYLPLDVGRLFNETRRRQLRLRRFSQIIEPVWQERNDATRRYGHHRPPGRGSRLEVEQLRRPFQFKRG